MESQNKSINPVKVGDFVTLIRYRLPTPKTISGFEPKITVLKKSPVAKAGTLVFSVSGRNYKQNEIGKPASGLLYDSYVIAIPSTVDETPYIEHAVNSISSSIERTAEKLESSLIAAKKIQESFPKNLIKKYRDYEG